MTELGPGEVQKLEVIEALIASLRDDFTGHPDTLGQRSADKVASFVGSWKFLLGQGFLLLGYVGLNIFLLGRYAETFDPYPFILLNLVLSFQAAFTAPIILMVQNRTDHRDRRAAQDAYRTIGHIEQLVKVLAQSELDSEDPEESE